MGRRAAMAAEQIYRQPDAMEIRSAVHQFLFRAQNFPGRAAGICFSSLALRLFRFL